jgi:hypothetical protein
MNPAARTARARLAAIERHNGPGDPRIEPLRRELEVESLAEHACRVAPLLTDHDRARLVAEIVNAAGVPTPELAAQIRAVLPLSAPQAVARAS